MTRYSRQDVLRILRLQAQQLVAWEREGLIPTIQDGEQYDFQHLARLKALREMRSSTRPDLRSRRISARSIRAQVDAMQRVAGMRNALVETSAVRRGARLAFRHGGALVDPLTQQLAFDFANLEGGQLRVVGGSNAPQPGGAHLQTQLQEMFARAVQLEENPATVKDAVRGYEAILELKPDHAPACINLGTIFYNQRDFDAAERMYRRATEADPEYALAFFDLGNVLDEMQRLEDAIAAYQRAIRLVPQYADAHYNLALAFERQGERRRALKHWMAYVRLDPVGPWAAHAKGQARKILALERLSIVSRGGMRVSQAS